MGSVWGDTSVGSSHSSPNMSLGSKPSVNSICGGRQQPDNASATASNDGQTLHYAGNYERRSAGGVVDSALGRAKVDNDQAVATQASHEVGAGLVSDDGPTRRPMKPMGGEAVPFVPARGRLSQRSHLPRDPRHSSCIRQRRSGNSGAATRALRPHALPAVAGAVAGPADAITLPTAGARYSPSRRPRPRSWCRYLLPPPLSGSCFNGGGTRLQTMGPFLLTCARLSRASSKRQRTHPPRRRTTSACDLFLFLRHCRCACGAS